MTEHIECFFEDIDESALKDRNKFIIADEIWWNDAALSLLRLIFVSALFVNFHVIAMGFLSSNKII